MSEKLFNENDGMDEDICLMMYDNNYELYKLVLDSFLKDVEKTITGMKETYAEKDEKNYRVFVHGLKGAGGSAGAKHLVDMATRSNDLIKEGKWEEACTLHEPILEELERLRVMIPERIQSHNG